MGGQETIVLCRPVLRAGNLVWMSQAQSAISDAFSRIVKRHRAKKGLSRAALAKKAGLHQTYIGLLEREKRSPNLDTAKAIAKALDLTLTEIIAEAEKGLK
jgi:ribosome-binding protein aMBF1 (putative translation factor)